MVAARWRSYVVEGSQLRHCFWYFVMHKHHTPFLRRSFPELVKHLLEAGPSANAHSLVYQGRGRPRVFALLTELTQLSALWSPRSTDDWTVDRRRRIVGRGAPLCSDVRRYRGRNNRPADRPGDGDGGGRWPIDLNLTLGRPQLRSPARGPVLPVHTGLTAARQVGSVETGRC